MSRGPWQKHSTHCPRCGHYARQLGGKQPNGRKGFRCAGCAHWFSLMPGAPDPGARVTSHEPGPYAKAAPVRIGRGSVWHAGIV